MILAAFGGAIRRRRWLAVRPAPIRALLGRASQTVRPAVAFDLLAVNLEYCAGIIPSIPSLPGRLISYENPGPRTGSPFIRQELSQSGQVEFWARLGRSVETLLEGRQVLDLCRKGTARPILDCLESVDTPGGRMRVAAYLAASPFPHYAPHPDRPGLLIRTDEAGVQVTGRFVKRQFRPVEP